MKEDIDMAKQELNELKEHSLAMELLKEEKKNSKRFFVMWIITFLAFLVLLGYTIYLLNDIGTIEDTESIEIVDVETIDNTQMKDTKESIIYQNM